MNYKRTLIGAIAFALFQIGTMPFASAQSVRAVQSVTHQPATYAFNVGSIRITALFDGLSPAQDLHKLLLDTTDQRTDALLKTNFLVSPMAVSLNAYTFTLGKRVFLVDTGSGDLFGSFGGELIHSLKMAGLQPDQVTDILLTHCHDDHEGGLVHNGHLVFPNATLHVGKPDVDFFLDKSNAAKSHVDMSYFDQAFETVKPYVDAGKVQTFSGTTQITPEITATLHPGHTPGSAFYTVRSQGEEIIFTGDIVHIAEVQFSDPTTTIVYDVDPKRAAEVREQAFAEFTRNRTLIAVPHMPFPGVGHVRAVGSGYEWVPVDYGNPSSK